MALSRIGRGGTDISDGLGADLIRMCERSGVGARIWADRLPIAKAAKTCSVLLGTPSWVYPFALGGDFQFLVTIPSAHRGMAESFGLTSIGIMTNDESSTLVLPDEREIPIPRVGHEDGKRMTFAEEVQQVIEGLGSA